MKTCGTCKHAKKFPGWTLETPMLECVKAPIDAALEAEFGGLHTMTTPDATPYWCPGWEGSDDARGLTLLRNPEGD